MTCFCHTICGAYVVYTDNSNRPDIPTDIGTSTTHLDLKDNQITGLSGGPFDHLTSLEILDLGTNQINYINNTVFSVIKLSIKEIILSKNKLTTITFMNSTFRQLETFNVNQNLIIQIPQVFNQCPKLKALVLSQNKISQIDTNAFLALSTHLSSLRLSYNKLVNVNYMNFTFPQLKTFSLGDNPLLSIPVGFFNHIPLVNSLTIFNIGIINIPSNAFTSNTYIYYFWLHHNKLVNVDFLGVPFNHVYDLQLQHNQLTSFDIPQSWQFPNLVKLHLDSNPLTSVKLTVSHNMPRLKELHLEDTQITGQ